MKYHTLIIYILAVAILYPSKAHAFDYPNDQPTIEALISLHKLIKKEEEKALEKVAVSYGEQSLVTKGATKFNDVRMTLNSKLNNACSYVILGAALASTGTDLYRLIDQYATFTKNTAKYAFKKPAVMWYYTEANYACAREIKNIKALYATLTASGLNLMRASMDEGACQHPPQLYLQHARHHRLRQPLVQYRCHGRLPLRLHLGHPQQ